MGKFLINYRDYGDEGETSLVTVPIVDITDANIVAQTTLLDTLRLAIADITVGGLENRQLVAWTNYTQTSPATAWAQREIKWRVRYHEDVANGTPHKMEIPCADLTYLDPNSTDKILMTAQEVIDFVAAFEAVVNINGNSVVVDGIDFLSVRS